jgi:hypothetical protein
MIKAIAKKIGVGVLIVASLLVRLLPWMLILIVVLVAVPAFHDMENRKLIYPRYSSGIAVMHELIAYHKSNGVWPSSNVNFSKNGVTVLPEGEVNISVNIPNLFSGSEEGLIVLKIYEEDGEFYYFCLIPGVSDGAKPPQCRDNYGQVIVKDPAESED